MKQTILFISYILVFTTCKKEPVETFQPSSDTYGFMTAIKRAGKSGAGWQSGGGAFYDKNYSGLFGVYGTTEDDFSQLREELSIFQIPLQPEKGIYQIEEGKHQNNSLPVASYARLISDGDVLGAYYYVKKNSNSWIEVLEIDSSTNIVKGRFEVHFEIDAGYKASGFPDEVHFDDGYFEVEIWK